MIWLGLGAGLAGGWIITQSRSSGRLGPGLVVGGLVLVVVAIFT